MKIEVKKGDDNSPKKVNLKSQQNELNHIASNINQIHHTINEKFNADGINIECIEVSAYFLDLKIKREEKMLSNILNINDWNFELAKIEIKEDLINYTYSPI